MLWQDSPKASTRQAERRIESSGYVLSGLVVQTENYSTVGRLNSRGESCGKCSVEDAKGR